MHTPTPDTAATDTLRLFVEALPSAARSHLILDTHTIPLIHTAVERMTVDELAKQVSVGIGWHTPANAPALLRYRLARAAGRDIDDEGGLA